MLFLPADSAEHIFPVKRLQGEEFTRLLSSPKALGLRSLGTMENKMAEYLLFSKVIFHLIKNDLSEQFWKEALNYSFARHIAYSLETVFITMRL